jgi:arsenate reductase-like glutaredoxin family protein|tara:strand:- start:1403 stop:1675 length:273 start_codon:yes stop_codon:yes gene_type:complete
LEANKIEVSETIPASRKLQASDARGLLKSVSKLIVAKGKKVNEFTVKDRVSRDAVEAMLGPTGNLRAPAIRAGKTMLVGFNEEIFEGTFG